MLGDHARVWQTGQVDWLKRYFPTRNHRHEFSISDDVRRDPSSYYFKLGLVVALGTMVMSCSNKPLDMPQHSHISPTSSSLRVATYNVFSGTHDVALTVKAIRQMHSDVLLLQELSPQGSNLLNQALKSDYPYRHFSEGVAIMSRFPLRSPRYERSQHGINGYLVAEIASPSGRFQVASLHLDPLHMWTTRDKWALPFQLIWGQDKVHRSEVKQIIDTLQPSMPTILGGDFNSVSGASIREFKKLGFKDSFASVNMRPDKNHTLHFKLLGFQAGRRIDYILHNHSFQTIQSKVIQGAPSDHDAVMSVLEWR